MWFRDRCLLLCTCECNPTSNNNSNNNDRSISHIYITERQFLLRKNVLFQAIRGRILNQYIIT